MDETGALGIPMPWNRDNVKPFSFVNTKVARAVQHAFHALALDERRNLFTPTLWELPQDGADQAAHLRTLKQCWFPGSHANAGGSYPDADISNITLAWMIAQLEEHDGGILSFSDDYLDYVQDLNRQFYASAREPARPWAFGKLYNSSLVTDPISFATALLPIVRTPGRYHRVSTEDGTQTRVPLQGTGECIHRAVRVRIDGGGKGPEELVGATQLDRFVSAAKNAVGIVADSTEEAAYYQSPALSNYTLVEPVSLKTSGNAAAAVPAKAVFWKAKDGKGDLPEDVMGETEIRLLKRSLNVL